MRIDLMYLFNGIKRNQICIIVQCNSPMCEMFTTKFYEVRIKSINAQEE